MRLISLEDIKKIISGIDLFPIIKEGFVAYSSGNAVVPPIGEMSFDNPQGDVHIKYGYIKDDKYFVVKIASGFYGDSDKGIIPTQGGMMLLFDKSTGKELAALVDECYLTNIRTAIAGGICAEILAPEKINCIGVIGTGVQARMQVLFLSEIIECRKLKVWGRNKKNLSKYKNDISIKGWDVEIVNSTDDIAESCNLIITATPSKVALLKLDKIKPGTHITALGSDSIGKQELDSEILDRADLIIADSISQCIERGEIAHALKNKLIGIDDILELGEVIHSNEDFRCRNNQVTVADLTGVAVQDIQIAKAVYKSYKELKNEI